MDKEFEVVLTGPANVRGKRQRPGQTVCVTKDELRDLTKAKAVAPDALELADSVGETTDQIAASQSDILADAQAAAFKRADALQSLNEELVAKNKALQAKLDAAETDKANLADEIAKADLAITELKAEFDGAATPDPDPPAEPPAPEPKPTPKPVAKTTRKAPAKSAKS